MKLHDHTLMSVIIFANVCLGRIWHCLGMCFYVIRFGQLSRIVYTTCYPSRCFTALATLLLCSSTWGPGASWSFPRRKLAHEQMKNVKEDDVPCERQVPKEVSRKSRGQFHV